MLAALPAAEREHLLATGRRRYARGEVLHRDNGGEDGHAMFLVATGRVAIRVTTPRGDEVILRVLGPGEAVGTEIAQAGPLRGASVVALEPTEAVVLRHDLLDALRAAGPEYDRHLLTTLTGHLALVSEHLLEMLSVPPGARVLRRLLAMADEFGDGVVRLTQLDLALMAGTTRPTANEVLRRASHEGAVALQRGRITVLDRELLARRAR